jgi:hypothetical protein
VVVVGAWVVVGLAVVVVLATVVVGLTVVVDRTVVVVATAVVVGATVVVCASSASTFSRNACNSAESLPPAQPDAIRATVSPAANPLFTFEVCHPFVLTVTPVNSGKTKPQNLLSVVRAREGVILLVGRVEGGAPDVDGGPEAR